MVNQVNAGGGFSQNPASAVDEQLKGAQAAANKMMGDATNKAVENLSKNAGDLTSTMVKKLEEKKKGGDEKNPDAPATPPGVSSAAAATIGIG